MTTDEHGNGDNRYRDALAQIAAIAASVTAGNGEPAEADTDIGCRIKVLPPRLRERAAANARSVNPVNAPLQAPLGRTAPLDPQRLTLDTARYWGPARRQFTVSFLESTPADLRARIVEHMNAWNATCGMSFVLTNETGEVRISRGPGGFWSYLGTDIRLVPTHRPTMNLQGFTMNTRESEYHRVVRHEAGHTLGFPHEHMRRELVARIDPPRAYAFFLATQGWNRAMVDAQVLTALDDASIFGTPADQDSIMCYQLPGQITVDGRPIRGGLDINATDAAFAGRVYPPAVAPAPGPVGDAADVDDWDEAEDPFTLV